MLPIIIKVTMTLSLRKKHYNFCVTEFTVSHCDDSNSWSGVAALSHLSGWHRRWVTETLIHTQRETHRGIKVATTADANSTECVSQQELAAVKAEMERKVDKLHSQFDYWQNVTVNILKDQCSSFSNGTYSFGLNSLAWLKHWTCSKLQSVNLALRQRSWYLLCSIYPRAVSDWYDAYLPTTYPYMCLVHTTLFRPGHKSIPWSCEQATGLTGRDD